MKLPFLIASLVLAAGFTASAHAAEAQAGAKPDPAKLDALTPICQACHTSDGTRGLSANPILQGQHPEYILKQLTEFKAGKRVNAIMQGMVAALSPEDMQLLAGFYGGKKPVQGTAQNKDTVLLGEKIFRGGILERSVPACAGCHSPNGAGIPAQYPRVSGQHAEYTTAQLLAFRSGERGNSAQMETIAGRMSDKEIKAVADYMAGLR
ncbi:MAG: c-type cytochrome [Rubrivivax sp.]|nr:c-type cytochrome [Rubrivivax sp.]